jgi:hypothetical protein
MCSVDGLSPPDGDRGSVTIDEGFFKSFYTYLNLYSFETINKFNNSV